jgi:hypothetical protein
MYPIMARISADLIRARGDCRELPGLRDRSSFQQQHEALRVLTSSCGYYRAGGATTDDDHIILYRTSTFLCSVEVCFVLAAKICPTRVAKGISSAAYRSLARGLALSFRISTIVVA